MSQDDEATLNIGALSMATGVPVETIRTWERRYGFPDSQRNDAGHRIYDLETIEHLRLITSILACGYRPSQLEGCSTEELQELLVRTTGEELESREEASKGPACRKWLECWIDSVRSLERKRLEKHLRGDFSRMNALVFLQTRISPFLIELGEQWADGQLSVLHEHFASECVRSFLATAWQSLSNTSTGAFVVLATPSGEEHGLGLHMAALVAAMTDHRVLFLGTNTPVDGIAEAAIDVGADKVALSISSFADRQAAEESVARLVEILGPGIEVLLGGRGAPSEIEGVTVLENLEDLLAVLDEDVADES